MCPRVTDQSEVVRSKLQFHPMIM